MRRFSSLEDFLASTPLTVDEQYDDGWGELYPVKGREIDATILFSDISNFSGRTRDLLPVATLSFVNHFFTWIAAEAMKRGNGIVDKYIGDEVMIAFSEEFGSADPFGEAVTTARWMGQNDVHAFVPHIGIASGAVMVGYVGTSLRYQCSVFGKPVALAARCSKLPPSTEPDSGPYGAAMIFPASEWRSRDLEELLPPDRPDLGLDWSLLPPRTEDLKGLGDVEVQALVRTGIWIPGMPAEEQARQAEENMRRLGGRYWPRQAESD